VHVQKILGGEETGTVYIKENNDLWKDREEREIEMGK